MKNIIVLIVFMLSSLYCFTQVTIKGTTVGTRCPEAEEIVRIAENEYLMLSLNNNSSICCYLTLSPVDSDKEIVNEWVTAEEFVGVLEVLQNTYGERFTKEKSGNDMLSYTYKTKGCEIQLTLFETKTINGKEYYKMVVEVWHEKELEKQLNDLSLSWSDWENRDRNSFIN